MSTMTKWVFVKKPNARLDYDIDLAAEEWLADGDTIVSLDSVTITDDGDVEIYSSDFTTTTIKVWLEGGTAGDSQHVSVDFTTSEGRKDTVCFTVRVKDC